MTYLLTESGTSLAKVEIVDEPLFKEQENIFLKKKKKKENKHSYSQFKLTLPRV